LRLLEVEGTRHSLVTSALGEFAVGVEEEREILEEKGI
jgi:hypothetical protein